MSDRRPRIIAHRGFAGVAPENTVAAFRAVADGRHPADMIELDVMPCAEGTVVIFHDHQLEGRGDRERLPLTDASGVVWETPCATVTNARVFDSDETIPTLAEVVDAVPPSVGLNVELRNPGSFDVRFGAGLEPEALREQRALWAPFVEQVLEILAGGDHELLLSSFFEGALASLRDYAPDIPAAVNVFDPKIGLDIARRYECEAIHPRINMLRATPYFEEQRGRRAAPSFPDVDLLQAARELHCAVNVWTIKTAAEAEAVAEAGVHGIIADYPGLLDGRERRERS